MGGPARAAMIACSRQARMHILRNSTFACRAACVRHPAERRAARLPRLSSRIARVLTHFPFPLPRSVPVQTH